MGIASKYGNNVKKFNFQAGSDFEFFTLQDLFTEGEKDERFVVRGFWISEGTFGKQPIAVLDNCYVNLPPHLLKVVTEICADEEAVQQVNDGKLAFTIYKYYNEKYKKDCYSVNWIDL